MLDFFLSFKFFEIYDTSVKVAMSLTIIAKNAPWFFLFKILIIILQLIKDIVLEGYIDLFITLFLKNIYKNKN